MRSIGLPVHGVLTPPQFAEFVQHFEIRSPREVIVDFTGWHKFALHYRDRVFLFPRSSSDVDACNREVRVLQVLHNTNHTGVVPDLIGNWALPSIYRHPFFCVRQVRGTALSEQWPRMSQKRRWQVLHELGIETAKWHQTPIDGVGSCSAGAVADRESWWSRSLAGKARECVQDVVAAVERRAGATGRAMEGFRDEFFDLWCTTIARISELPPVFVHGDIHEGQILLFSGNIVAVLDWGRAGSGNPVLDFDFGEWGHSVWRSSYGEFSELRNSWWSGYQTGAPWSRHVAASELDVFFSLGRVKFLLDCSPSVSAPYMDVDRELMSLRVSTNRLLRGEGAGRG